MVEVSENLKVPAHMKQLDLLIAADSVSHSTHTPPTHTPHTHTHTHLQSSRYCPKFQYFKKVVMFLSLEKVRSTTFILWQK